MPFLDRQLGPYKLISQIAVGGMAEIYMAQTRGAGGFAKLVALKLIHPNFSSDPEFVRMLIDEAKLAVQLEHPNIVHTFDLGRVEEQYYIAMELIEGGDLYRILRRASDLDRSFPLDLATYIAKEACAGLAYAHAKVDNRGRALEIVHRDVSPQNILVSYQGDVKIVDFGIAKAAMRGQQTAAGVIKGKYYYMSPEQAWGDRVDSRSDIFSAGILLYEMLTGQMLYLQEDLQMLVEMVRKANIPPLSSRRKDVPPELEQIVMKALKRRAEERYQTAGEFAEALGRFLKRNSPDFSRARIGEFVSEVLGSPTEDQTQMNRDPDASTAEHRTHLDRDEHSLIFDLSDFVSLAGRPSVVQLNTQTRTDNHLKSDTQVGTDTQLGMDTKTATQIKTLPGDRAALRPDAYAPTGSFGEDHTFVDEDSGASHLNVAWPNRPTLPKQASPIDTDDLLGTTRFVPRGQRGLTPKLGDADERTELQNKPIVPVVTMQNSDPLASPPTEVRQPAELKATTEPLGLPTVPPDESRGSGLRAVPRRTVILGLTGVIVGVLIALLLAGPSGVVRGTIQVRSQPEGAEVRIDGVAVPGKTPMKLDNVDGRVPHRIRLSQRGFEPWEEDVRFEDSSGVMQVQVQLQPSSGTLQLSSTPEGAEAIVNGRASKTTPLTLYDLPPNEDVIIELRLRGYKAIRQTVPWNGERHLKLDVPLEPAR